MWTSNINRTLSIECFQSNAFNWTLSIKRFQSNAFNRMLSIERFNRTLPKYIGCPYNWQFLPLWIRHIPTKFCAFRQGKSLLSVLCKDWDSSLCWLSSSGKFIVCQHMCLVILFNSRVVSGCYCCYVLCVCHHFHPRAPTCTLAQSKSKEPGFLPWILDHFIYSLLWLVQWTSKEWWKAAQPKCKE